MENSTKMIEEKLPTQLKDPKRADYLERREKILRAVITWLTRNDRPEDRKGLLEWFFNGNIEGATEYQLKTKRRVQAFSPALFENHDDDDDDSTFSDKDNRTPLHCCLLQMKFYYEYGTADHELISELCELGMSVIALDHYHCSPLGIALDKRRMDLIQIFVRFGSDKVADINNWDQTILHVLLDKYDKVTFLYEEYQCLVMELLSKGADVNKPDHNGVTSVHLAAEKLDITILKKFKENGADLNFRKKCGDDLLIIICKRLTSLQVTHSKALKLINWLVNLPDFCVNPQNDMGFTALHYAAKSNDIRLTRTLIRAGVDVHAVADDNTNILHSVTTSNNFEELQHLIEQNVDFRRRDNVHGFGLLHMAAFSGDSRKCEWLIKEKQFDVDDLGNFQLTPLHLASIIGKTEVVRKLIQLGADVHREVEKFRYSALHLASMSGQLTILINLKANDGKIYNNHSSIVADCYDYYKSVKAGTDYNATLMALLDAGTNVNAKDSHGCTPLHYASRYSFGDTTVIALLKAGAHVDVQDNEKSTPLGNSYFNTHCKGYRSLLTFGANINDIGLLISHEIGRLNVNFHLAAREIMEHLLKLKIAGLPIDERLKNISDTLGSNCLGKQSNYSSEIAEMKKRMLTDEVSLYDLLNMSFRRRSLFANSLPRDVETVFPNYYVILKGSCNEALNRMALFKPAVEAFQCVTNMQLPIDCIDYILSFMSNLSLRILIDAANLTK